MKRLSKAQNLLIKQIFFFFLLIGGFCVTGAVIFANSSWINEEGYFKEQKIPFSHETHVQGVGLQCQFCHAGAYQGAQEAELPSTQTCYGCHREILKEAGILKPLRESYLKKKPMAWNRVNRLADHVHFHHSKHTKAGVSCTECHGDVANMPLVATKQHFSMEYCLDCHRTQGPELQGCYTCHR